MQSVDYAVPRPKLRIISVINVKTLQKVVWRTVSYIFVTIFPFFDVDVWMLDIT